MGAAGYAEADVGGSTVAAADGEAEAAFAVARSMPGVWHSHQVLGVPKRVGVAAG